MHFFKSYDIRNKVVKVIRHKAASPLAAAHERFSRIRQDM